MEQKQKDKIKFNCVVCNKEITGIKIKEMCQKCYNKKWKKENPEKVRVSIRKWKKENPEKVRAYSRKWKKENSEKVRVSVRKWKKENPEKANSISRKSKKKNHKKVKAYGQTPKRKVSIKLRGRVINALKAYTEKGKIKPSDEYGINYEKIIELLKPFPEDQSKYHIDHIRPLCSFELTKSEEIKKAFAPENHQWLLVYDNLSKGGKWDKNLSND